ncbi:MAG: hypothetical protein HY722_01270, partial [Planctomycetes bacterium]|nr:hypothetical protein [Planctomycetota bacterium]
MGPELLALVAAARGGEAARIKGAWRAFQEALWAEHALEGRAYARALTEGLEALVRALHDAALGHLRPSDVLLLATGGFARRQLSPRSDVDLLIVHGGVTGVALAEYVARLLQPLWDAGLHVGHACRLPTECREALERLSDATAMLEARPLTPEAAGLARFLEDELLVPYRRERGALFGAWKLDEARGRHGRFGDAVCVKEPHIKEGKGGLRDHHVLCWLALAQGSRGRPLTEWLAQDPGLTDIRGDDVDRAEDFLLRVRHQLHRLTDRHHDVLEQPLQIELAAALGYHDSATGLGVERFMRDYYLHARRLSEALEIAAELLGERGPGAAPTGLEFQAPTDIDALLG